MDNNQQNKPVLHTILSPALTGLYNFSNCIVVVIDVLRATSTIATALFNGAREVIPVTSVEECIRLSGQLEAVSAGERDGQPAKGLQYGNSPMLFSEKLIGHQILVLTTTNGTQLIHDAISEGANEIIAGSFCNLQAVSAYLRTRKKDVILACAGWRKKINIEDTLFAGAVIHEIKDDFDIQCDSSAIAENLYISAQNDLFEFMKENRASHYNRLISFQKEDDLRYCFQKNVANILPVYKNGRLVRLEDMPAAKTTE